MTTEYKIPRGRLLLGILLAVVFCVGLLDLATVYFQRRAVTVQARELIRSELQFIGHLIEEELLQHRLSKVAEVLEKWAKEQNDIKTLRAFTPNGFEVIRFERNTLSGKGYLEKLEIRPSGTHLLTIEISFVVSQGAEESLSYSFNIIIISLMLIFILIMAIWITMQRTALVPLENEIQRRKESEASLEKSRTELETKVLERTAELSRAHDELEERVSERTSQLAAANEELETFSYSVSHDLRAPLRHIHSYVTILKEDYRDRLDEPGQNLMDRICSANMHMDTMIEVLLGFSKTSRAEMIPVSVNLSRLAEKIVDMMREAEPERQVKTVIAKDLTACGDANLLEMTLQNLLGNAWKYSVHNPEAVIEFGKTDVDGKKAFFIRDNGAGFDMAYYNKLFRVFERLHGKDFEGTGIGLATARRIITRHGGEIWAEGAIGKGATFYFSLPGS